MAGILEQDGRILICRRRADQPHALKWEFPGGKIEDGETPQAALERELHEELGIGARVGSPNESLLDDYEFAYPEKKPIRLIFLRVEGWEGGIRNLIFDRIEWARREELKNYDFLEGDVPFLARLTAGGQEEQSPCSPAE